MERIDRQTTISKCHPYSPNCMDRTRRFACEVRLVTYYDKWFRFQVKQSFILLRHSLERVEECDYDSDE